MVWGNVFLILSFALERFGWATCKSLCFTLAASRCFLRGCNRRFFENKITKTCFQNKYISINENYNRILSGSDSVS